MRMRGLRLAAGSWKIICILARADRSCLPDAAARSLPWKITRPDAGLISRSTARPKVVFPEPDSPTMPRVSPGLRLNDALLTAMKSGDFLRVVERTGKVTVRCSTWRMGSAVLLG